MTWLPRAQPQAMQMAMAELPRVGSRIVQHNGTHKFHLDAAEIIFRLIVVAPDVLISGSPPEWRHVCETMAAPHTSSGGALFEAYMLTSHESSAGSVLIAGFNHALGDATSYSMFMCMWSTQYRRILDDRPAAMKGLPSGVFDMAMTTAAPTQPRRPVVPGRFCFTQNHLQSLKAQLFPSGAAIDAGQCTTNDILMAQFACAIAPARLAALRKAARCAWDPIHKPVQILVLADQRGRGVDAGSFGNHTADLSVQLSFQLLLTADVAAVAKGQSHEESHLLLLSCVWFSCSFCSLCKLIC